VSFGASLRVSGTLSINNLFISDISSLLSPHLIFQFKIFKFIF
jgi:hypothetical protein